jgi:hypothetical protein
MRLILVFIILAFIIINCDVYKTNGFSGIDFNTIKADTTFSLRTDGLYTVKDNAISIYDGKPKPKVYSPLIFLNKKKVLWTVNVVSYDDSDLKLSSYLDYPNFTDAIGDYVVRNDTIWAKIPITLKGRGAALNAYESYFQGEIKNRDTIINWHMIPPFPKANRKWNDNFDFLIKPNQLYFIEGKELLGLDSLYQQRLKEQEIKK